MPQLNLMPWFFTLTLSWLLFFTLIKIMTNQHTLTPPNKHTHCNHLTPWTWMWP
uniref:ATP synthase complex subunit 8 n=1 Tax=Gekko vittatus TaxID=278186 RepID=A1IGQ3_9SAUR|nr:ATP synthase F0 subunit 8 [Gekko vittatus]BAF44022.1 ATPase subunit 8 [Gekko vittatus]